MTDEPKSLQDEIATTSPESVDSAENNLEISVENAPLVPSALSDEPKKEEESINQAESKEKELIPKKLVDKPNVSKKPARRPSHVWRFQPIRTIIALILIILLLLLLIKYFGLGSGGGEMLPGKPDSPSDAAQKDPEQKEETPDPTKEEPEQTEPEPVSLRWELVLSFFPAGDEPTSAKEFTCRFDWTDPESKKPKDQTIIAGNKEDFERALETTMRAWKDLLKSKSDSDILVLVVQMSPFPGDGTVKRIESLTRKIDERISIMQTGRED